MNVRNIHIDEIDNRLLALLQADASLSQRDLAERVGLSQNACWRRLQRLTEALYDIRIDPEADIGPGLYIGHFGGVYIGRCRVGRSCAVHQQAKLGAPRLTGPIIGDHVWIGPHARIAPPARVGDGATILSGAQVDSDIPPRALAGGAPARIIRRDYDNGPLMRFYADD